MCGSQEDLYKSFRQASVSAIFYNNTVIRDPDATRHRGLMFINLIYANKQRSRHQTNITRSEDEPLVSALYSHQDHHLRVCFDAQIILSIC